VSDNYLRIIPADVNLMPPETIAAQIVKLLEPVFPDADKVVAENHGHPIFIDQGANLEAILCPACGRRLPLEHTDEVDSVRDWWYELSDPLGDGDVTDVRATMPCCQRVVPFSELQFDWPAGVASFEISILNPRIPEPPSGELERKIEVILGSRVRYVWAHY
jgi:hypothetical protein